MCPKTFLWFLFFELRSWAIKQEMFLVSAFAFALIWSTLLWHLHNVCTFGKRLFFWLYRSVAGFQTHAPTSPHVCMQTTTTTREMTDDEVGHLYHILQRAFGVGSTSTSTVLLSLLCPSILLLHCTQNVPFSLYKIQVQLHYYSVPAKQLLYPIPNFAAWSYPPFFACVLL